MKNYIIKMALLVAFITTSSIAFATASAQNIQKQTDTTVSFMVYGNCGMCEKTIEGSLKVVKGISEADWDKTTKLMSVTFNKNQISLTDIKKKIASVGYDTDAFKASDETYGKLPGCCKYERP